ncbi:MAG: CDP-alcohol phosphatidyltransferase family protein, partial [Patescibacteria group bacterium]
MGKTAKKAAKIIKRGEEGKMNISERIDRFFDFIWKFSFNADEFRWKQQWYQKNVVRRWAYIHEDIWTSTRYLAYPIFKLLWTINPWLALFVSIYVIGASDYIDGEVARYREKERKRLGINISGGKWYLWIRKNFGHINDGFADRCMAVLTIDFLASSYVHSYAIAALYVVEFGGYPLVCILEKIGIVKADYFHSWTGKTKFNLEIVLITFLVVAEKLFPGWIFIPLWTSVFLGVVYLFAVFSIGCKINPMFLCFLPHAITAGSVVAAGWGVYEAVAHKNFYLAAPLMMISAICDVLDGPIARKIREIFKAKKTNFGVLADDTADWLNYALGLAIILFMASINFFVCLFYVLCTTVRLIYFYRQSKKEGEKKEGKSRAIFNGIPST